MSYAETSPAALERHECECAAQDALTAAHADVCSEITVAFTQRLRRVEHLDRLQIACIFKRPGIAARESTEDAENLIQGYLGEQPVLEALERLIRQGDGTECDDLRAALAEVHCGKCAEELAIVRMQGGDA